MSDSEGSENDIFESALDEKQFLELEKQKTNNENFDEKNNKDKIEEIKKEEEKNELNLSDIKLNNDNNNVKKEIEIKKENVQILIKEEIIMKI